MIVVVFYSVELLTIGFPGDFIQVACSEIVWWQQSPILNRHDDPNSHLSISSGLSLEKELRESATVVQLICVSSLQ